MRSVVEYHVYSVPGEVTETKFWLFLYCYLVNLHAIFVFNFISKLPNFSSVILLNSTRWKCPFLRIYRLFSGFCWECFLQNLVKLFWTFCWHSTKHNFSSLYSNIFLYGDSGSSHVCILSALSFFYYKRQKSLCT